MENQYDFQNKLSDNSSYTALRGSFNQIKMFYGIKKSIDMALLADKYDYIIRLRPDVIVHNKLNILDFYNFENNVIYSGFGDVGLHDAAFVISSSMAYSLSKLIQEMFDFNSLSPYRDFPLYDSHNLLLLWVLENNYTFSNDVLRKMF